MSIFVVIVLIESDWNLKIPDTGPQLSCVRINRIRLEFKASIYAFILHVLFRINRIRLEFKDPLPFLSACIRYRINRIRLEFKVVLMALTPAALNQY